MANPRVKRGSTSFPVRLFLPSPRGIQQDANAPMTMLNLRFRRVYFLRASRISAYVSAPRHKCEQNLSRQCFFLLFIPRNMPWDDCFVMRAKLRNAYIKNVIMHYAFADILWAIKYVWNNILVLHIVWIRNWTVHKLCVVNIVLY